MLNTLWLALTGLILSTCSACNQYNVDKYGPIDQIDRHGISIASNGFNVNLEDFENEVERTWEIWHIAFYFEKIDCYPTFDDVFVSFRPVPFEDNGLLLVGEMEDFRNMVWGGGWIQIQVVYDPDMQQTALGHELGHTILALCDLPRWETELHWWADHYGVPY